MTRMWQRIRYSFFGLAMSAIMLFAAGTAWANGPTLVAQKGVTAPASISELARALKYDAGLIYEYVYTNIDYSPTFGLKKGALGTLLDGQGNDIDQSALLVALLRESGYTANYVSGAIRLGGTDLNNWLGVDVSDGCPTFNVLNSGGIPFIITVVGAPDCSGILLYADISHMWVTVTGGSLGSTTYVLDPSFKTHVTTSGTGLASAMGYNASTFHTSAMSGASYTAGFSIQNVNQANIATALTSYASNLVSYIRTNTPTATTGQIIGGKLIKPLTQPYTFPTSLAYQTPGTTPTVYTLDSDVRTDFGTTFQVQIGGVNKTYYGDQIYGHRLSVVYNTSNQPVLYLDGVSQGTGTAGATTLSYTVVFPFCFATTGTSSPSCGTGYTDTFNAQNVLQAGIGYTYAIVAGWDFAGRGMADFHRRQLQALTAAGGSVTSEPLLGESLNVIGYTWLAQVSTATSINDQIIGAKTVTLCAIGVVGQATAPYIDIPGSFVGVSSLSDDLNRAATAFFSSTGAGSAFEWGVLDQSLSTIGNGAVSTIKLIDFANSQHSVIYDATSTNWGSIQPLLNYSPTDMSDVQNYITLGFRLFVPQNGKLSQGSWTGAGYLATGNTAFGEEITYKISHNLKGGYSYYVVPAVDLSQVVIDTYPEPPPPLPQATTLDPIDLSSGAFLYSHSDISIGSDDVPIGLSFGRSYSSNNLYVGGALSPGWAHNFSITAVSGTDGFKGMGQDSPIDGAAAIAAAYVIQDLFSDTTKPLDKVVIASLVQKWLMDRLINNTVNVTSGSQAEQFVLLADGSYSPQLGSSNRLSLSGGTYALKYKDGTAVNFDVNGNISTWQTTAGNSMSFTYDASTPPLLTSVTNSFGRSLSVGYNSSHQLTSVTDSSTPARSIGFAYDASGRLTSFTDTLGNVTTYAYTGAGGSAPPGLLTQVFYPSNPASASVSNTYDSLGRVASQANANGAIWNYFFAGYRSEEDDPYNTQHVLYYNPRGKALFDIQDYAGLGLLTSFAYDGLDRLTSTTLPQPQGGGTAYTYDATTNPWANNVATIVRTPQTASPLSATTTTFAYDPVFNKPTSIVQPPTSANPSGMATALTYDATGNLLSVVADAGASPHLNARTSYAYNSQGLVTLTTDPLGVVIRYSYDGLGFGNLTAVTADAGGLNRTTIYAYNRTGDAITVTDPSGNTTTKVYDTERRLVATTTPATTAAPTGILTTFLYDPDSRPLNAQQCINPATGPPCPSSAVLRSISTTYTPTGQQATATDPNGNVTRYTYDLLDRLASTTDAALRVTTYAYDVLSRPTAAYNAAIQTAPLVQQTYTSHDLPATLTDGSGNETTFTYDGFDRLSTIAYPLGSTEAFTYDGVDNVLTRTTRARCAITFAYDTLNRLSMKTIAVQGAPCVGSPAATQTTTYAYDLAGQLTGVSDNSTSIQPVATGGGTPFAVSYTYDALNQPTGATWSPAPTATAPVALPPVAFGHSYNAVNQRIGQTVSDNSWIAYPAATPSTTAYTANALNQYTAVGAVTPTYDGNGNLTSDGTTSLTYDAENRLLTATVGGSTATYAYDAQGRRKSRSFGGATTITVTDADGREVLEYDGGSGAIGRWYAYGLGPNDLLNQMNVVVGTRATVVPDLLGSVVALLDSSTGALAKSGYLAYGTSTNAPDAFGYTGQRIDPESGFYYYRARHYSPFLGRFLQADPLAFAAGLNFYAYVDSDPLNAYDPYGLKALDAVQLGLTAASFCPSFCGSVFSLADAAVSGARGNYVGAAISLGAAAAGLVTDAGAVKVAALGAIAAKDALKTVSGVAKYEVGTYSALKARSVVGDALDIHHAVQTNPARQVITNYNVRSAASIALTKVEHAAVPTIAGPYGGTARDLLAKDIRDLRNYTGAPNSALQELISLNKRFFPSSFAR